MKKKFSFISVLVAAVLCVTLLATVTLADAGGFAGDSDWGSSDWGSSGSDWGSSGSDWGSNDWSSSGSDWGSSDWGSDDSDNWSSNNGDDSDWDNDNSYGGGGNLVVLPSSGGGNSGGSGGGGSILPFLIVAIIVIVIISRMRKKPNGANVYQATVEEPGLPLDVLKEKDPDFNEQAFLEGVGNRYVELQRAWETKDWEPMRGFMTDALYNQMGKQLDELKARGWTNHIERIAVLETVIRRYAVEGDNDVLTVRLQTRICDYTTDDATGKIVSGDRSKELFMTYDWKFTRQTNMKTRGPETVSEVSCPNCGAPLSINQTAKCPYCDTVVTLHEHDWALSAIKGIAQRSNG